MGRSVRITASVARNRRSRPFLSAIGRKSDSSEWNSGWSVTFPISGRTTPASSFEMSSNVRSRSSIVSKARSTWATSCLPSAVVCNSDRAETDRWAAFNGCSTSWLAAARNRVLDRLACSALSLAETRSMLDCSSRRSAPRRSSVCWRTRPSRLIAVWNSEKALPCCSIERSTRLIRAWLMRFSRSTSSICEMLITRLPACARRRCR